MTHLLRSVILCGGAGSRLWPASRPYRPKPFLTMVGEESLLGATVSRVAPLGPVAVMVGPQHLSACRATIPSIERLIEPAPRGTAAAVLAAAAWARDAWSQAT